MFIWLCLRWWYGAGWVYAWRRGIIERLEWCEGTFSMTTLVRTWFSPYKQTYTGKVRGSLEMHLRAAVDGFISRIIGFLVRTALLIAGAASCVFVLITGFLWLAAWPFIPMLPVIGIVLFVMGAGV
jgi:hypothetical protein